MPFSYDIYHQNNGTAILTLTGTVFLFGVCTKRLISFSYELLELTTHAFVFRISLQNYCVFLPPQYYIFCAIYCYYYHSSMNVYSQKGNLFKLECVLVFFFLSLCKRKRKEPGRYLRAYTFQISSFMRCRYLNLCT